MDEEHDNAQPTPTDGPAERGERRKLRVIQLNCQKSMAVMADLGQQLLEERIDVALLQEPHTYFGLRGLPSQYAGFTARGAHTSLAAVAVRQELQPMVVSRPDDEDGVLLSINWGGDTIFIASIYCKWFGTIDPYLELIDEYLSSTNGAPILFGIDANATDAMWHSKPNATKSRRTADRGADLAEYLARRDMTVLNTNSPHYTFCGHGTRRSVSDIDVSFVSRSWTTRFDTTWRLIVDRTSSDHNMIRMDASCDRLTDEQEPELRWITKEADWPAYVQKLRDELEAMTIEVGLTEYVDSIHAAIQRTNNAQFTRLGARIVRASKWWNDELRQMRGEARKARRRWQTARRDALPTEAELGLQYHRKQSAYNRAILAAKESHWRTFVREEGNENPWGPVYKFCRGKRPNTPISAIVRDDGSSTTTRAESLAVLMANFFPTRPADEMPANHIAIVAGDCVPITIEEVDAAVHRPRRDKAPGPDGIMASMVRQLWYAAPTMLLQLFERCRIEGEFPARWKLARLVILLKAPDKDRTDRRSYRPICLLSVLGKTLERIMVNRLLQNETPHPKQFGFTTGRSTEDAMLAAREATTACEAKYLLGIFVDFRGAFDNLRWDRVMEKLATVVSDTGLWRSYFSDRTVYVRDGETEIKREVQRGCPQGSICGPAVWSMMVKSLLERLETAGAEVIAYADDLLVLVAGNSRVQIERVTTERLRIVSQWGEEVGVPVNLQKTVQMLLKGNLSRRPIIHLGDGTLRYETATPYLGIRIGERWSFSGHMLGLQRKVAATVASMRRVLRKEWGLTYKTVLRLYKGLIIPCVTYGSPIWAEATRGTAGRASINRAQRAAILAMLPVCKTVSTAAMQVLAGGLPWDLEVQRLATLAKLRRGGRMDESDPVSEEQLVGLRMTERKALVLDAYLDMWQSRWDAELNGRVTHRWMPDVRFVRQNNWFSPSLQLTYLLTGHGSLNSFLYDRNREPSAACPSCSLADETWVHVLVDCPVYADIRQLANWRIVIGVDGEPDVGEALREPDTVRALNAFAKEAYRRRDGFVPPERRQRR